MMACYRDGGCGPYEMYSCNECPASKPDYKKAKSYPPYLDYPKERKKLTNADKIRQMSDEELAEWYYEHQSDCSDCLAKRRNCMVSKNTCKKAWLDWLKQEVESDG